MSKQVPFIVKNTNSTSTPFNQKFSQKVFMFQKNEPIDTLFRMKAKSLGGFLI